VYCVHLNAGRASDGTLRKGWACYDRDGYFRGFVRDVGIGAKVIVAVVRGDAVALPGGRITSREYQDLLRDALN